jgi:hypothetical protein
VSAAFLPGGGPVSDKVPVNSLTSQRKLEIQLADKRNQRELTYNGMWDKVKRVRAGVKANYGDDSQQFEMVGGTRTSDRKPRTRRAITTQ